MDNTNYLLEECSQLTLLYVEDDDIVRMTTMGVFENIFLEVLVACDGEEALTLFKKNDIDMVITDITMPKLDGLSLVKEIRKFDTEVKILIFSAYKEKDLKEEIQKGFIDGYLLKPIDFNQVITQIKLVVNNEK